MSDYFIAAASNRSVEPSHFLFLLLLLFFFFSHPDHFICYLKLNTSSTMFRNISLYRRRSSDLILGPVVQSQRRR